MQPGVFFSFLFYQCKHELLSEKHTIPVVYEELNAGEINEDICWELYNISRIKSKTYIPLRTSIIWLFMPISVKKNWYS